MTPDHITAARIAAFAARLALAGLPQRLSAINAALARLADTSATAEYEIPPEFLAATI